jgi:HSP90 family molecular chaperone
MRLSTIFKAVVLTTLVFAILGEESATAKGSPNQFDANVAKMLNILINSLYTNRAVFLREIISNASDALDKIRFLYLTNPKQPKNDAGEEPTMDIRIRVDRDKRTFVMIDGGIGMTADELKNNLGSLGTSGTQKFLDALKDSSDSNFIGQFGVGFYSVFLVADRVIVASKHDDSDKQWVWESTGDGTFYLYEDERGNTLGRGTELTLELKKDADEFLEHEKVKEVIHRHSEFIHFPIYIQTTKIEQVPKKKDAEKTTEEGEVVDEATEDGEEKKEEFDHVPTTSWTLVNENKPIWTRKPEELVEEDYNKFYKALTKDHDDPMFYTHFSTEGEMEFKALLFIPGRAPYNVFDTSITNNNIRLYVRRVFITDEFKDLLPRYLNFIKGIVDSDDLPLHVSREVLQESRILKIIKKKLVRKALQMLADIAEGDKKLEASKKAKDAGEEPEEDEAKPGQKKQTEMLFDKFWTEFGKNLRLGMIEDGTNRARLTKLLRYKSSKSEEKLTSLDEYVARCPEKQKAIYFLTGESVEKIKQMPVLEDAIAQDVEVLYMVDAIDEYVVGHVTDHAGKKLVNLAKEPVKREKTKRDKAIEKKRKEKYQEFTDWFKNLLGEKVTKVSLTERGTKEPMIVSSPQHGLSATMARIQKSQTLSDKTMDSGDAKRVLELNYLHPLTDDIFKRITVNSNDKTAEELALVLYDVASLQGGFEINDNLAFGQRIGRLLRQSVNIAPDQGLVEESIDEYLVDYEEDEEAGKEKETEEAPADAINDEM